MARRLVEQRSLILQLIRREVAARYKTTFFGMVWPLLMPLLMLGLYTFVFGQVFAGAIFDDGDQPSLFVFAIKLYCGLIVFNVLGETLTAAVSVIIANPNYVKKVVFPLEILPVVTLGVAVYHFLLNFVILLVCAVLFLHAHSLTMLLFPLAVLPTLALAMGLAWAVAAIGVFARDLGTIIGFLVQLLLYASPVFYPLERVPEPYRSVLLCNPLTYLVEAGRRTLLMGKAPQWGPWLGATGFACVVMLLGYMLFMRSHRAFNDVL